MADQSAIIPYASLGGKMEEEEGNGAATPPLEPRRHELLAAAVREGDTPAAAVSIHMNFEGSCENFL